MEGQLEVLFDNQSPSLFYFNMASQRIIMIVTNYFKRNNFSNAKKALMIEYTLHNFLTLC